MDFWTHSNGLHYNKEYPFLRRYCLQKTVIYYLRYFVVCKMVQLQDFIFSADYQSEEQKRSWRNISEYLNFLCIESINNAPKVMTPISFTEFTLGAFEAK